MTDRLIHEFLRDDAGTPLGVGMPSGAPLRSDGQSHYEAWQALLRRDPCAFCGAVGGAGTVDHVDPRSRAARGLGGSHGWLNLTGACPRCNGAKHDLGLLVFLYRRRWSGQPVHPGEPARAKRAACAGGRMRPPPTCGWGGRPAVPSATRRPVR